MRILIRSYDLDDLGGSGITLQAIARFLRAEEETVWATRAPHTLDEVRAWAPDVIVGQQWATHEASEWATRLHVPFVMLVHGQGQFEQFMPLCDLVIFNSHTQHDLARPALGSTPAMVLHPPVFRQDYETDAGLRADPRDPTRELVTLRAAFETMVASGRRRPTLTLCMTVANEAHTLEKAVESVASVADEIVIGVDRTSSDDTAAIARRLATRCFEFDESSPPHFPRMRNRAMDLVTTDWALVLDGHEWIEHADRIPGALGTSAWSIEIRTLYEPDENRIPGLAFPFPRIHRRHVRFVGAGAHEEVDTPLDRRDSRLDIHVWHERRPGAAATVRADQKAHGELDVLRAAWTGRRDRRALFYLANGLKDASRYDEAIECYESYLEAPNFPEEGWQALLYLARCRAARHEWHAAKQSFERAVLAAPERAEGLFGLAQALLAEGQPRPASSWFRLAASLPEPTDCRMFVEVPIYRWAAWHGLALALDRLGDYTGAADAEARARAGGAGVWATHNIDLWRTRAGNADTADAARGMGQ